MKYIFLALFVLLATQPLQASSCDMCDTQGTQVASHSQHDDSSSMECCDEDSTHPSGDCARMAHCGASATGVLAVDASDKNALVIAKLNQPFSNANRPPNISSSPPFRPPIAS